MDDVDLVITGGTLFDGVTSAPRYADVAVHGGKVVAITGAHDLAEVRAQRRIDARGLWVTPGFIDIHTHYDAELVAEPGLVESVRHGVTTVVIGNCSLSVVAVDPDTAADLFARVEAIPHEGFRNLLARERRWTNPAEYREWISGHPLGPNVAAMIGHSDIRASVMGLQRSTSTGLRPTRAEAAQMKRLLHEALDCGFLGLSTMTTTLDKVAGDIAWSEPLPSTFAQWGEYRQLHEVLRRRGRVLQSAPNAQTQLNVLAFMMASAGWFRQPLRVSLLAGLDLKVNRASHILARVAAHITNTALQGNLRWQTLPGPFTVLADGVEFNNFEEFATGRTLRDLKMADDQYKLLLDRRFQVQFVKDMSKFFVTGLWHRRFEDAVIVSCPDRSLCGRSFGAIGKENDKHPAEVFLDLAAEFKARLRWRTTIANDRPKITEALLASSSTQIGFSDAGAHLRNLAFYNFPLRALRIAQQAELSKHGRQRLTVASTVKALTADLADWWGIDAGRVRIGKRADLVVLNPQQLSDDVFDVQDQPGPVDYGIDRIVNRNDDLVEAVVINGSIAYTRANSFDGDLGRVARFGTFLESTRD